MRRTRPQFARALALSASVALLATACGDTGDSNNPSAGGENSDEACEGTTVNVGVVASVSDAPLFIANEKGYFEEEGLDINFQGFASAGEMIAPLGSGDLHVGAGAPSAGLYSAVARDVDLRIVADKGTVTEDNDYMPLMVRTDLVEDGTVEDVSDLEGMTIAEPAQATATASSLSTVLSSYDLNYEDVEQTYLGFGEHLAAFSNGGIDASLTTEPNATLIEKEGVGVRFLSPAEYYGDQQLAVVLYSDSFAENTAAGNCFMNGYVRGARDYVAAFEDGRLDTEQADEVVDIVSEAADIDPDLYRDLVPNYVDPNGTLDEESLQRDYDFFVEQGYIEGEPIDLSSIIDTSFTEAAVNELGEFTE